MVKVLYILVNNVLNGTERYVLDLAAGLNRDGFETCVATPLKGELSYALADRSIEEFIFDNGKNLSISFKGAVNLLRFIRKRKFDIIHSNFGIVGSVLAIFSPRTVRIESRHGIHFTERQLTNPSLKLKIWEFIKGIIVNYYIVSSKNDGKILRDKFKVNGNKVKVIYNGLDMARLVSFRRLKDSIEYDVDNITLGNVGRLAFQKGQDILINFVSKLKDFLPNIRLIIWGEGEEKANLTSLIRELKLEDCIEIRNYSVDIHTEIAKLNALVLTSRFEGIPYILLDSMYIGTPVISTGVGGISEMVNNGKNGIIISVNDLDNLAESIAQLLKDKVQMESIQKEARDTIEKYSIGWSIENTKQFYNEVLNK